MTDKTKHKIERSGMQAARLKMCEMIKNIIDNESRSDHTYAEMVSQLPTQYSEFERNLNEIRMDIYRRKTKLVQFSQDIKCS